MASVHVLVLVLTTTGATHPPDTFTRAQTLQQAVATEQALSWPLVNCLMSPLECLVPHPAFRQSAAVRAQRLSRHLMNVLASVRWGMRRSNAVSPC